MIVRLQTYSAKKPLLLLKGSFNFFLGFSFLIYWVFAITKTSIQSIPTGVLMMLFVVYFILFLTALYLNYVIKNSERADLWHLSNKLVIASGFVVINDKRIEVALIKKIEVYIDGYQRRIKILRGDLTKNKDGSKNKITIHSKDRVYKTFFFLINVTEFEDLKEILKEMDSKTNIDLELKN